MIILNGEPFTRFNLRSLYPHAHQIIVVEGATAFAAEAATAEGHSSDETLEILREFKRNEDPESKLTIVTAEDEGHPNGFWPGEKTEMSQAYARRATGDWLWQVDSDEFYREQDFARVFRLLHEHPETTAVSFVQFKFFGALDYFVDGPFMWGRVPGRTYHRLFRWKPGYRYKDHRPPTVVDETGKDLRDVSWIDSDQTHAMNIRLFHYSMLFPAQVHQKVDYYQAHAWPGREKEMLWRSRVWEQLKTPFHIHNVPSIIGWPARYSGEHPVQAMAMWQYAGCDKSGVTVRRRDDVEAVLRSLSFRLLCVLMRFWPSDQSMHKPGHARLRFLLQDLITRFDRFWRKREERK